MEKKKKIKTINYFISSNYVKSWGVNEALREILQNFIDYGEYNYIIYPLTDKIEVVRLTNTWKVDDLNFLLIGESTKTEKERGQFGEGLKLAALVLLREGYNMFIITDHYKIEFTLLEEIKGIKTLGARISTLSESDREKNKRAFPFSVVIHAPISSFKTYLDSIIKPEDVIHYTEGFGSIVNKSKGEIYVGGLYVCTLNYLNYAYDFHPSKIKLDRDRKVPQDFDVKWAASKIQETFKSFDLTGNSTDQIYSVIRPEYKDRYKPIIRNNEITYITKVIDEDTQKTKEVEVSESFKSKLTASGWFDKTIFKMKQFLSKSLTLDKLALKFREKYCTSEASRKDFDIILLRIGITPPEEDNLPF